MQLPRNTFKDALRAARPQIGLWLGLADAYATAALAMGERGPDWLAARRDYESAVVTSDGRAMRSDGLPSVVPTPPVDGAGPIY
jgi:2-keto-3-deoxy-L-rhamnonate aldolase RhmA